MKFVCILMLALSFRVAAFELYQNDFGQNIRWTSSLVTYSLPPTMTKRDRRTVSAAFEEWGAIVGIQFVQTSTPANIEIVIRKHNELPWDILGMSTINYNFDAITSCMIELNYRSKFTRHYLATLVRHEIGHCLGIAHSPDPSAIMYPSLNEKVLDLAQDDFEAAMTLYPRQ